MNEKKKIEDIIAMLDGCIQDGVGHINLQVNEEDDYSLQMETYKSNDCSLGNQACAIPNMQDSIDKELEV